MGDTKHSNDKDQLVVERLAEVSDLYDAYITIGALGRLAESSTIVADPVVDTQRHPVGLVIRSIPSGF